MLDNIKVVLCDTSHNGNIGSAARAMKTMGIYNLILVNPLVLPDDHSIALSSNARDVVENAIILKTLDEAIADATLAIGLTGRRREFSQELQTPKNIIPEIFNVLQHGEKIALVFGAEKTGLTTEQLEKCNRIVTIPGNPEYFSLNLAQAVQIICYEIYSNYNPDLSHLINPAKNATMADNAGVLTHLNNILSQLDFYKNKNYDRTMRKLQHIIHKAHLEREEIDLIRGMLHKIEQNLFDN